MIWPGVPTLVERERPAIRFACAFIVELITWPRDNSLMSIAGGMSCAAAEIVINKAGMTKMLYTCCNYSAPGLASWLIIRF